ncbi:Ift140 protein [Thecamonas trahens ATCC 50062]|uniref:Ift140 protein n=1 Tax=Thecamonas trahens ATCC 50062 TaxID=461836 RepID=A0A0L0DF11_THETB|nr:Ift140 protein [Thecamonas trahens ATCC 50062]KNC50874.1 Ift140 protein [Thecamonas trahens ATCC 50062]|eukprot:XP_013756582.1 Ift140 protein [Thecamonas trahens ATCC 50062]
MDMIDSDDEPGLSELLVWDGARAHYYHVTAKGASLVRELNIASRTMALHRNAIVYLRDSRVLIANTSGIVKETLSFSEGEGLPRWLSLCGHYMAVLSSTLVLKLWNLSRRKAHQYNMGRQFEADGELFAALSAMAVNADGTRVAFLGASSAEAQPAVAVFEVETDSVAQVELNAGELPCGVVWSTAEPRLLAVETVAKRGGSLAGTISAKTGEAGPATDSGSGTPLSKSRLAGKSLSRKLKRKSGPGSPGGTASPSALRKGSSLDRSGSLAGASGDDDGPDALPSFVVTLFATPTAGVLVQSRTQFQPEFQRLVGIEVPYLVFALKPPLDGSVMVERLGLWPMQDFVGMESPSATAFGALLDFSYHLTIGNMDEAFKAVKLIESDSVWQNMASMCVKTRRLDVAEICLAHMGHIRGVRALREARRLPEHAAQVAMLAVQLGELEAAEALYLEAGRPDLLNKLYQASNQWRAAVDLARSSDRIHLRNTFFKFGKYLESIGETKQALQAYERAGLAAEQVPRLLARDLPALEQYVKASNEPDLIQWWAQFAEVNSAFDQALMYYEQAGNYRAVIKILCYLEDFDKAGQVCDATKDPAACYLYARHLEAAGSVEAALNYYNLSKRFNHAIQLGMKSGMDNMVLQMALQAGETTKLAAAAYFETKNVWDRAILLYHRGGRTAKAVDLAFSTESFDALRELASSLDSSTDPALLNRCASFFLDHAQYDKAVSMLIAAGQTERALQLAVDEKIAITDEMAEALSPDASVEPEKRAKMLSELGSVLARQGSYRLACKKYAHAGDKISAMKCLIKSGDTSRIMFFANVCRKREVYILAANALQQADWHGDAEIRKGIITFYTKAKQYASLARFYDACARLEVDEYRNYEQATNALAEGIRIAEKATADASTPALKKLLDNMQLRLMWIERFVHARSASDPNELLSGCRAILDAAANDPAVDDAVRTGDIYEVLIQLAVHDNDMAQAYRLIQIMLERGIDVRLYLERNVVERVFVANNASLSELNRVGDSGGGGDDNDNVVDVIDDDL